MEKIRQMLNQTTINLEDYLRNMRRISDAMYYTVIKNTDIGTESLDDSMTLLYEANKDKLVSVACYTNDGNLTAASPVATQKNGIDVTSQAWFQDAVGELENFHFSTPHVKNLFDDPSYRYYWVVSLSRTVELTRNGVSMLGVLLVDMNYSSIEQLLEKANTDTSGDYVYLMAPDGEIIYHPKQNLIHMGLYQENNEKAAGYEDITVEETFHGEKRLVTVKTISYTGWKLVSVVPMKSFSMNMINMRNLVVLLVALTVLAAVILNQMVSARISKPLRRLNDSVKEWEAGNMEPDIYIGGSMEVEHLGKTLRSTVAQIRQLMDDIVVEQEEKRKSELDALQSQINPHFLYNTLDSIVRTEYSVNTMVENGVETEKLGYAIANWNRAQAQTKTAAMLTQFEGKIELIIANNDDMALGAIDALKVSQISKEDWPGVVGIDGTDAGLDAVKNEEMLGTVYNDKEGQAQQMLNLAFAIATNGDKSDIPLIYGKYVRTPYHKITLDNIDEYENKQGTVD